MVLSSRNGSRRISQHRDLYTVYLSSDHIGNTCLFLKIGRCFFVKKQKEYIEYQEKGIHKNIVTANSNGTDLMQIEAAVNEKVYSVHLEFAEAFTGIGEEIRDTLKEKYLQKMKSGSMQMEPNAVEYSSQNTAEEREGNI